MFYSNSKVKSQNKSLLNPGKDECKEENEPYQQTNLNEQELEKIQIFVEETNILLSKFCQLRLGDLVSNQVSQKFKTIEVVKFILQQLQRLQESNLKLKIYCQKADKYLFEREEIIQQIKKDQKNIEAQKQSIILKKQKMQITFKQNTQKVISQRDELQKQLKKIQARQKAIDVQFRKRDNQIKFLQDGIKKLQQKNQSKSHHFQVYNSSLQATQYEQNQFDKMALQKFQSALKDLTEENIKLKSYFIRFAQQLNNTLQFLAFSDDCEIQLKPFKPETFKMSIKINQQHFIETINMLHKLQDIFKHQNLDNSKPAISSNDAKGDWRIKQLIQNYKQIILSQEQAINKITSKQLIKSAQILKQDNNLIYYQFPDFQNNKSLLQQQIQAIESKNKSLYQVKKKLQQDVAYTQSIKVQLLKQKRMLQGQAA